MKSFEEILVKYIEKELNTLFTNNGKDYVIHCTQDVNTYLEWQSQFDKNEIFAIINTGGATQTTPQSKKFFTQAFQVIITCEMNKKKEVYTLLDSYTKSATTQAVRLDSNYSYYGAFSWMTPTSDSNIRVMNGARTMQVVLTANITWCGDQFNANPVPVVKIDGVELNGIYSVTYQKSSSCSSYTILGNAYQKKIEDFKTTTYTIEFLYDESNAQKGWLGSSNYNHTFIIKDGIEEVTFSGFGAFNFTFNMGTFTSCSLTIVR